MSRRIRGLALAAAGGLLLVAPAATAFKSPVGFHSFQSLNAPLDARTLDFRGAKREQMYRYDKMREQAPVTDTVPLTDAVTLDAGSRYDGKRIPI